MTQSKSSYKKNYELKNMAKDALQGKFGTSILILFLYSVITTGVSLVISLVAASTTSTASLLSASTATVTALSLVFDLLSLAASIVLGVFQAGISFYFLNLVCGQPYSVNQLFYGFRKDSGKALLLSGAAGLCNAVCLYPSQYFLQSYQSSHNLHSLIAASVLLLVGMVIYIPVSLGLSQSFYLMLDYPDRTAKEILSLSFRVMKGQKCRLFWLQLSFLPLMLLCICSFGIGFLWLTPYMQTTYAYYFLDIMKPSQTTDTVQ